MKLTRVGLLSLACVGGAFAFGVAANAALDLVLPPPAKKAEIVAAAAPAEPAEQPVAYTLASATSSPADFAPIKVRTIPMVYREDAIADLAAERPANVPLPRPRPATAPMALASTGDAVGSIAHQPGTMAIAAATRKAEPDDGEVLGAAGIERMRTALALTAEQEEYWPAIAAELRALGKAMKANARHNGGKLSVDQDTIQRLYWAAAPLITRLSYEQKMKAKQMARLMGLNQVAEAL
jgi:hypothetical protein